VLVGYRGKYHLRVSPHAGGNPQEFQNVNPTLARFIGRHEGLRLVQAGSQILLPQASLLSEIGKDFSDSFVFLGRDPHGRSPGHLRPEKQLNRKIGYCRVGFSTGESAHASGHASEAEDVNVT
jgi:hypothetical protein